MENKIEEKTEKKENFSGRNKLVASFAIVAVVCFSIGFFIEPNITGNVIGPEDAASKAVNFINNYMLDEGAAASLINVSNENGMYLVRINILIGGEIVPYNTYVTRNGNLLFINGIDLTVKPQSQQENQQTSSDPEELEKFVDCLKDADLKIYGANWCGYTKQLVTMLGGFDAVKPIYVECTENQELCSEMKIEGYPTIFIKGELYQGYRTFEALSAATGCSVTANINTQQTDSSTGDCGS